MSKHRETGHMVERSPGKWSIVLSVKDATTGKRKRQWHSFAGTKREAAQERIQLLAALNQGSYVERSKMTVAEFVRARVDQWEAAGEYHSPYGTTISAADREPTRPPYRRKAHPKTSAA
jgi:hypothetical protein